MDMADTVVIKQHLIDPEICIRCNTCEATCPAGAITHDSRIDVVDAAKCNLCMDCVPPCPPNARSHAPAARQAVGLVGQKQNEQQRWWLTCAITN